MVEEMTEGQRGLVLMIARTADFRPDLHQRTTAIYMIIVEVGIDRMDTVPSLETAKEFRLGVVVPQSSTPIFQAMVQIVCGMMNEDLGIETRE